METSKITRAALGSIASLGDLYDARRDDFCGVSIFKTEVPKTAIAIHDANFSDIRLVHSDDFSDKAAKLDISAELQASILAGLLTPKGSACYLCDEKKSARTVKSSLVYNIKTKDESLNIYHDDLRESFAIDAIDAGMATHVVVGISWGANSILSCFYANKENKSTSDLALNLSTQLQKACISISGDGKLNSKEGINATTVNFEIHVFGDILSENQLPTSFATALEFITQVPTLVKNCNGGKGKPLMYQLLPIALLQKYLKLSIQTEVLVKSLDEAVLARVLQMFQEMSQTQQTINDIYQDALTHSFCLKRKDIEQVGKFKNEMAIHDAVIRAELSQLLQEVRSGKTSITKLNDFVQHWQSSCWSSASFTSKLGEWSTATEKIRLAQALVLNGAKYIGYGTTFVEAFLEDPSTTSYILYFDDNAKDVEPSRWSANKHLFFQAMRNNGAGHKYYAVDCDIHPELKIKDRSSCVQTVKSGIVLIEDLLAENHEALDVPTTRFIPGATTRTLSKPNKRVPLVIPCAGEACNVKDEYEWTCKTCKTKVEYGFDKNVYCVCGQTPVTFMEFKCTNPKHGHVFEKHNNKFLTELLSTLRPFPELNILILGETGVGKSTWINGFINYMTYDTLEDAEAGDLMTLIPSEFTVFNEDYTEVSVCTGEDSNEIQGEGQSATQEAKVYAFPEGNKMIRLIDTPGIGDTRGIEQDQKNFRSILATLTHFDEIHGICILLKPNNARLSIMFRFCIKELLTYLHRGASKNIVFCFTNSRGTFYRPGDTMKPLTKLLAENKSVEISIGRNTVYCFDSEAYRYLAAVKNETPVTFSDEERLNFSSSWEKSIEETKRMLAHFQSILPHDTKSTVNLNYARTIVISLPEPLAEINKNLQINKKKMEDEKKEIELAEEDLEILKQKLTVTRTMIEIKRRLFPGSMNSTAKTVGATLAIGSLVLAPMIAGGAIAAGVFTAGTAAAAGTVSTVSVATIASAVAGAIASSASVAGATTAAAATTTTIATTAGAGFTAGALAALCVGKVASSLRTVQTVEEVTDQSAAELFNQGLSPKQIKIKMIELKDEEIREYEAELEMIERASVIFAYFLKSYSITPYNDAVEQYMNHLIKQEEEKEPSAENIEILARLKKSKASYLWQKEILEQQLNKNSGQSNIEPPGPKDVDRWIIELQRLKHSGPIMVQVLDCVTYSLNASYSEMMVKPSKKFNVFQNIGDKVSKKLTRLASF